MTGGVEDNFNQIMMSCSSDSKTFFPASHAWYMTEDTFKFNSSKTAFEDLCV